MNEQRKKSQGKNITCWQIKFVKYIYSARKKKYEKQCMTPFEASQGEKLILSLPKYHL